MTHTEENPGAVSTDTQKWKDRLGEDICRAYIKTSQSWVRDSWSLCHGNWGNIWMLKKAEEIIRQEKIVSWEDGAGNLPELNMEVITLLPQEKTNPGLLNGYGVIIQNLLNLKSWRSKNSI